MLVKAWFRRNWFWVQIRCRVDILKYRAALVNISTQDQGPIFVKIGGVTKISSPQS